MTRAEVRGRLMRAFPEITSFKWIEEAEDFWIYAIKFKPGFDSGMLYRRLSEYGYDHGSFSLDQSTMDDIDRQLESGENKRWSPK